jgi:hypothetical protein
MKVIFLQIVTYLEKLDIILLVRPVEFFTHRAQNIVLQHWYLLPKLKILFDGTRLHDFGTGDPSLCGVET